MDEGAGVLAKNMTRLQRCNRHEVEVPIQPALTSFQDKLSANACG